MKKYSWIILVAVLSVGVYFLTRVSSQKTKITFDCVVVGWDGGSDVIKLNCINKKYDVRVGNQIFLTTYEKNAVGQEFYFGRSDEFLQPFYKQIMNRLRWRSTMVSTIKGGRTYENQ